VQATDAQSPGLRERKKRQTRAELSWAAIRLVVERGYDDVRVEDIAAAAEVSTRTFNNYFTSKGEAVAARHLDRSLEVADNLRARPAGEPLWTALRQAMYDAFTPGPEVKMPPAMNEERWNAGLARMMSHPAWRRDLLAASLASEQALAAAVAARTGTDVSTDLYPNLVASTLTAATATAIQHRLRQHPPPPMEHLLREAIRQLAAGMPEPGR
jgi:AcrR family transcriptional regulator